ncbi:MAG: hypothetical protein JWO03_920 [Bacteroidetes bacterium]|nr:hypothetical protein [Bacteroidota bacterium]
MNESKVFTMPGAEVVVQIVEFPVAAHRYGIYFMIECQVITDRYTICRGQNYSTRQDVESAFADFNQSMDVAAANYARSIFK